MKPKTPLFFCSLLLIGVILSIYPAQAYSIDYLYVVEDAKIYNQLPDTNYGSTPVTTLGNLSLWDGEDSFHIGYFKFDFTDFAPSLSSGEEIQYEGFYFDLYSDFHYGYRDADNFFRLCYTTNQTWDEDSLTWNDSPSYTQTSEIVEVTGADQYFIWDLDEISLDVQDAISNDQNLTFVILYYGLTQGWNSRFKEYGGVSYDPRVRVLYQIVSPTDRIYEREPSLASFPIALGEALHIGTFGGKMLASMVILLLTMLPTYYACQKLRDPTIPIIIIGLGVYGFLIAIDYLPVWSLLVLCMLIALFYAQKISGVFKRS